MGIYIYFASRRRTTRILFAKLFSRQASSCRSLPRRCASHMLTHILQRTRMRTPPTDEDTSTLLALALLPACSSPGVFIYYFKYPWLSCLRSSDLSLFQPALGTTALRPLTLPFDVATPAREEISGEAATRQQRQATYGVFIYFVQSAKHQHRQLHTNRVWSQTILLLMQHV